MVKSKVYKSTITSKVMAHNVPILKITDDEGNHHYGWYNGEGVSSNQLYINMRHHRLDGPAIEWDDGSYEWWVGDEYCDDMGEFIKYSQISEDGITILKLKWGSFRGYKK